MKHRPTSSNDTSREKHLVASLRKHPELFERMEAILALAEAGGEKLSADQVEELLIQEVSKLGRQTMESWAIGAEEQAAQELRTQKPSIRERKKND